VLVIVGPLTIVMDMLALAMAPILSVTLTTAVTGPPMVVGMPDITPVELRLSPLGRLPDCSAQLYGVSPPVAPSVCE
jgi:hypothetical protein